MGDVQLQDLVGQEVRARLTGTGRIALHVTESLDASVPGTGSIEYSGILRRCASRSRPLRQRALIQSLRMSEPQVADATRRTRLANERTYLAWLRSALTALAVAIGAGKIVPGVTDGSSRPFSSSARASRSSH